MLKSIFNKVATLKACYIIKKRLQHRCFPVNIAKFLRTSILKNICEQLRLGTSNFTKNEILFQAFSTILFRV